MSFRRELPLTPQQARRLRSVERQINRALAELQALAMEAGCVEPCLYYECEGSLCVFDLARGDSSAGSAGDRQDKVALSVAVGTDPPLDCGAW